MWNLSKNWFLGPTVCVRTICCTFTSQVLNFSVFFFCRTRVARSEEMLAVACTRYHALGSDFQPRPTKPSILPGSLNCYRTCLWRTDHWFGRRLSPEVIVYVKFAFKARSVEVKWMRIPKVIDKRDFFCCLLSLLLNSWSRFLIHCSTRLLWEGWDTGSSVVRNWKSLHT